MSCLVGTLKYFPFKIPIIFRRNNNFSREISSFSGNKKIGRTEDIFCEKPIKFLKGLIKKFLNFYFKLL